ncbi:MAG: hypothetical protein ACPG4Z_01200 [Chitinophagales bacterium]
MKYLLFLFSIITILNSCNSSSTETEELSEIIEDASVYPEQDFLDYIEENALEKPEYVKFFSNRDSLFAIPKIMCNESQSTFETIYNNDTISINVKQDTFIIEEHTITKDTLNYTQLVDGFPQYGATYLPPKYNLTEIKISVNGKNLKIPRETYSIYYDTQFCKSYFFSRAIESYISGDFIYMYIYGGNGADAYYSKLIFSKEEYVTSIIADYYPMTRYGCFHEGFIGF